MKRLLSCLPILLASVVTAQDNATWTPPITPWGEPDLAGTWPIDHMNQTPVQRPASFGTRRFLTDEEFTQREEQLAALAIRYDEEDASDRMGMGHWVESGDPNRLTSLIFDPPNGRVPPMTEYGQAVSATMTSTWDDKPYYTLADFNALERCITRGMPASMFPFMYNSGIQIVQSPGYVVINLELIHEARIIPTDGRPALAPEIKQWMGESRGHWEGNTLVIETTNFNAGSPMLIVGPGGAKIPTSEALRIVERLTRVSDNEIDYEIHVEDPQVLTASWSAAYPWRLNPDYEFFEYACHEDNVQLRYLLEHAKGM